MKTKQLQVLCRNEKGQVEWMVGGAGRDYIQNIHHGAWVPVRFV